MRGDYILGPMMITDKSFIQSLNKNYSKVSFINNAEQRNKVGEFILREGKDNNYGVISYQYVGGEKFLRRKVVDDTDEENLIVECIADGLHIEEKRTLYFGNTSSLKFIFLPK